VELCSLANPRRWHKKTLRRPWKHRDRVHEAVDDLGLEKAMKHWKRNPLRTRRNCDMTFLSQEQEDRIVSRIAASRNPQSHSKTAIHRWWRGLSPQKKHKVARSFLGRMNPGRNPAAYRGCLLEPANDGVQILWPDDSRTWAADAQRAQRVIDRFFRKHPRMVRALNPKRDGTPTRGEKRAVKYVEHLRTVMAASENARLEYQRLTGAVAKVGSEIHKPIGPRALKHAAKAHTEAWEAEHEAALTHHTGQLSAPSVAAVVAEHPELKFVTSQLSDLDSAIEHFKSEIRDLPKDDLSEDEEARLQEEIAKLARQKKKLREKLLDIQPAVATNPRRRSRRLHPRAILHIKRAGARCSHALRSLRSALRRCR